MGGRIANQHVLTTEPNKLNPGGGARLHATWVLAALPLSEFFRSQLKICEITASTTGAGAVRRTAGAGCAGGIVRAVLLRGAARGR